MTPHDLLYLHDRAEEELTLAQQAEHPALVQAHYLLASLYLDRLSTRPEAAAWPYDGDGLNPPEGS